MSSAPAPTPVPELVPLDPRSVAWERVSRAIYRVRVHYRYTYTGPIKDLKQRLVLFPPTAHGAQRLLGAGLEVRGSGAGHTVAWQQDRFGNRVCSVNVPFVEHAVDFEARYSVERAAAGPGVPQPATFEDFASPRYRQTTALTAPDPALRDVARSIRVSTRTPGECAERACLWTRQALVFQAGATNYATPAGVAVHLGRGVCQDFAHVLICVLRLLDIPARYVSGQLLGEGPPHAWVEALLPDASAPGGVRVLPLDASHTRPVGANYITVAVGRDFADVSPTSGVYTGGAHGRLGYTKRAEIVEIEYANGATHTGAAA